VTLKKKKQAKQQHCKESPWHRNQNKQTEKKNRKQREREKEEDERSAAVNTMTLKKNNYAGKREEKALERW
jgi:hypothetical protein